MELFLKYMLFFVHFQELFFQYSWNNFLHAQVEQCIIGIVSNSRAITLLPQVFSHGPLVLNICCTVCNFEEQL